MKKNKILFTVAIIITIPIIILLAQCKVIGEGPTIELEIYDGPNYSEQDNSCYYRVEANTTGVADSGVEFSLDDNVRELGPGRVEVRVDSGDSYTLTATAKNLFGTATFSLVLSGDCNGVLAEKEATDTKTDETTAEKKNSEETTGETKTSDSESSESSSTDPQDKTPQITGIEFSDSEFYTDAQYEFKVHANNPTDEELHYVWMQIGSLGDEGTINPTIWNAPSIPGKYEIEVHVANSYGEDIERFEVNVKPSTSVSMHAIPHEGGNILQDTVAYYGPPGPLELYPYAGIFIGKTEKDIASRGFLSFDISGIPTAAQILHAKLSFANARVDGDEHAMGTLSVVQTNWGNDIIELSDFYLSGDTIGTSDNSSFSFTDGALKDKIQNLVDNGQDRFQLMLYFEVIAFVPDGKMIGWFYLLKDITLDINYGP